ncbi:transmembrane protein C1orf162 homolog isoform X1 [Panthera leo]|uniref:transmembrane protein C1orf162 homolog isoform X1 n=1 Tax=Panthera leo TaxID=9689 RepID=UPI001C6A5C88|nr:transmembrane protein C1orf162 homolog isoform X1 [Panthera leo]XP_042809344.1 transmembrane protein C1orf162 homolog isoform X1 [Panthera leo]
MGGGHSKPECNNDEQNTNTVAPTPPFSFWERTNIQYLLLAFFAGVLITLLLLALIFFIIKSYRKRHSSPCALDPPFDPHSGQDSPAKLSSPEEALTYASMTFQIAEEKNHYLTEKHSAGLDPVVYSQIKVTNSPNLSSEA